METMIHVLATVDVVPGRRAEFLTAFRANVPNVLAEDGCLEYGPAIDLSTPIAAQIPLREHVVTIVEKWRDLAALQAHLSAPHMVAYRNQVKHLVAKVSLQVLEPA